MKKLFVLTALILFIASLAFAMGNAPGPRIKTGDQALDRELEHMARKAGTLDGTALVRSRIQSELMLSEKQIDHLRDRNYGLHEIYYMGVLAKRSSQPLDKVAALRGEGVGWGVMAHRLGIQPGEFNRIRVQMEKERKAMEQARVREHKETRIHVPQASPSPRTGSGVRGKR